VSDDSAAPDRPLTHLERLLQTLRIFYGRLPMPPDDPFAYYVWELLGVGTTSARREMAMTALRRIPALTPESIARAAPARIESAVALAGANRDDRVRTLRSGARAFRRDPSIPTRLRGPLPGAAAAAAALPRIIGVSRERILLLAGHHPVFPADAGTDRVIARLGLTGRPSQPASAADVVVDQVGRAHAALRDAFVYLAHHADMTCTLVTPSCRICPLTDCPEGRARLSSSPPRGA
jgi:endonuclease III